MPNYAQIPGKETSYSAARLSQLEGLGFGPELSGENLVTNQADPDGKGRIDSKASQQKRGQKRPG